MEQIIRLDNPNFKRINYLDYTIETKQEILKQKQETIKNIPKENILGLGYTLDYCDFEFPYTCTIREYVVINMKGFLTSLEELDRPSYDEKYPACSENDMLLFLPLVCICNIEERVEIDNYISNLKELGYVELLEFFHKKSEIIELFKPTEKESIKIKSK